MTLLSFVRANAQRVCSVRTLILALAVGMIVWLGVGNPSHAATFRWLGGGGTDDWGNFANWEFVSIPPTNGFNTDIFVRGSDTSSDIADFMDNDIDFFIDSLTFESQATVSMNLTGGILDVDTEIVNDDTLEQNFGNNAVQVGDQSLDIKANSGNIDFNTAVDFRLNSSVISVSGGNSVFFDSGITDSQSFITMASMSITGGTFVRIGADSTVLTDINISNGELELNSITNLKSSLDMSVSTGSTFDLNNFNANIGRLQGSGNVDLGSATLRLGVSAATDASFGFDGTIFGTGGLFKEFDGEIVLDGSNSYTGTTTVDDGILRLDTGASLSDSTDVVVNMNGTFDLDGQFETVDSISGTGTIRLGGGRLTVDENTLTRTFSGDILETGELQKNGSGTLWLFGDNEFTVLDINAGTILIADPDSLGNGSIELGSATLEISTTVISSRPFFTSSSSATLDLNGGANLTQTVPITGSGGITKTGAGILKFNTQNTYTGDTTIDEGTIELLASNAISDSSDVVLSSGGTLDLSFRNDIVRSLSGTGGQVTSSSSGAQLTVNEASGTFVWSGVYSGPGRFTKDGNHTMQVNAAQTYTGSTVIADGLLQFTGSGDFSSLTDVTVSSGATWDLNGLSDAVDSLNGGGNILLGGAVLTVGSNGGGGNFSGNISEAGGLNKSGAGTLLLGGNNSFDGELSISGGTVSVGASNNLGDAGSTIVFFGGTLQSTASFTNSRSIVIGPFNSGTFNVNSSTTLTQSGLITGDSTTTINKNGAGTWQTTSSNSVSFSGDIVINAGTFDMAGGGNALGNATTVTVNGGSTFLVNNPDDIGGLSGLNGSGSVVLNQILRIGHDNASNTFSGVISGTSIFGKRGTGTQTLTGNNTYTGLTDIDGGILRLSGSGRLSDSTDVDIALGATFDLNDVIDTIDALSGDGNVTLGAGNNTLTVGANNGSGIFTGDITESGTFVKVGSGTQTLSGVGSWSNGTQINGGTLRITGSTSMILGNGSIQLDGGTLETTVTTGNFKGIVLNAGGGTIDVNAGTSFTMTAGTPFTGVGALTKTDTGTLLLTANNTYTGDTNINAGTLVYSGSFAQLSDLTDVIVASGATWDLNGISDTVKSIAGAGNIVLNGGTLTVNQDGGATTFSGAVSDPGGITKEGSHTLTLSGLNDYEGPTTINEGVLQITEDFHLGEPASDLVFGGGTLYLLPGTPIVFDAGRSITLNASGGPLFGTIFLEAGSELTVPGVISGPGSLDVFSDNEESLVLSGVNSYQGGTTIFEAVVAVNQNANLGDNGGSVTLNNGGLQTMATFTNLHAMVLDGGGFIDVEAGTLTQAAGISGFGPLSIGGPGTLLLTVPATHAGNTNIASNATLEFGSGELPDAFDVTVSGLWDLNGVSDTIDGLFGSGDVLLGGGTLTVGSAGGDGDFGGSIQEAGGLTKTGSGTQVLSGTNTYTGTTTIDGEGTLEITSDASLGDPSSNLLFGIGTLRTTSTFSTGRTTTINTIGEFETAAGTTLTFTSPIDGGPNADLVKSGLGTLELTQPNTFGGLTEIQEGTLRLSGGGLLPSVGVDVFTGATLDATDITDTIGRLLGGGDVLLGLGTLTIGADDLGGTFNGIMSGVGGAIVKEGTGTQVFTGINTYTGGTFVNDGVLRISQSENLGSLGTLLSFDGGTLNSTATFSMIRGIALEAGGGTFDVDASTTLAASGNITGAGSLTKIGGGDLVLSGFSTYLGGTNVTGGVVEISSSVNLGSMLGILTLDSGTLRTTGNITTARPAVVGVSNGTIEVASSTTLTRTGIVSGAGSLIKSGDGILVLDTANSYLGRTIITAGTVRVGASNQLGDAGNAVLLNAGVLNTTSSFTNARSVLLTPASGAFDVDPGTTLTQSGVLANVVPVLDGAFTKSGGGVLLLTASNTNTGPANINAGTLRLSGAGRLSDVTDVSVGGGAFFDLNNVSDTIDALTGSGDVTLGSGTLTIGSDDGGGTYSGTISGTGGLVKIGTGTQLLRIKFVDPNFLPNTYTGGTAINGGVLDVEKDDSLGDPAAALSFDSGTLQVQGAANSVNSTRTVTLNAGGGTVNTVGMVDTVTFGGVIDGTGSLTKNGLGTLTVAASNTYGGNTTVLNGILRLSGAGQLPDTSSVVVEASGIMGEGFDLNDISDAVDAIEGTGDIHLGSGTLTIGSANGSAEFEGTIDGTGGIVKAGSGAQIFSGANTYTGATAIDGGTLEIDANNRLGDPSGNLSFDGGTLALGGTFTMARATTMNAGGGTLNIFAGDTLTHTAVISGSGELGKSNNGTLILSGINTYTGPTNIAGGTLQLGGIERLANTTAVSVSSGAVFDLNNFNESIDAISGAGSIQLGSAQLVIGLNNGSGTFSGVISGTGDLLKEGTGMQTLTGTNTFSGATFVDRGTLVLSGGGSISQATLVTGFNIGSDGTTTVDGAATTWDLSGNLFVGFDGTGRMNVNHGATVTVDGNVTVGGNGVAGTLSLEGGTLDNSAGNGITVTTGTLQGQGTVIGDVFNQDTLAPGNSAGILTLTGNYSQDVTGLLSVEIGGTDNTDPLNPDFDLFDISGTAGLAGQLELALISGFTPVPADTFTVLSSSALAGVFSNVADGARLNLSTGGTGSFQVDYTATALILSDYQGTGTSFTADFNNDTVVDGADLAQWQGDFGLNGNSDADNDGDSDGADFLAWQRQFGSGVSLQSTSSTIPEPASSLLLVWAAVLVLQRRRSL